MKLGIKGNGDKIALTLLAAAETAHTFSAFEPSVFTIRRLAAPQGAQGDIRLGYIPAVIMSLGISGTVAYLIKSWAPIIASMLVAGFTIGVYEWALNSGSASDSIA